MTSGKDLHIVGFRIGRENFGVPIALATALRRDPDAPADLQIGVNVQIPAGVPGPLLARYSLVDSGGRDRKSVV